MIFSGDEAGCAGTIYCLYIEFASTASNEESSASENRDVEPFRAAQCSAVHIQGSYPKNASCVGKIENPSGGQKQHGKKMHPLLNVHPV